MPSFSAIVLTLFPEMFPGPLGHSLAGRALGEGIWSLEALNIRDFATDKHGTVDDSPYGGSTGMVMKPDVVDAAVRAALERLPSARLIYLTPRGIPLNQALVHELARGRSPHPTPLAEGERGGGEALAGEGQCLILLCGRFEGVDQRVIDHHRMLEISAGDYVLSGGEIAAMALLDACVRLLPGVIGKAEALAEESFNSDKKFAGLLEYPHYTRPPSWNGLAVPEVLLSGHHEAIRRWRLAEAENVTRARRQELWELYYAQKRGN